MKKTILSILLAATVVISNGAVASAATTQANSKEAGIQQLSVSEETFTISSTGVNAENGKANITLNFGKEEFNSTLVIYDNGKEIYRQKVLPPSSVMNIEVQLPNYDSHQITAKLGIASPNFEAYTSSNTIVLGYFDNKINEKAALSYIQQSATDTNFKVVLPYIEQNVFVNVYDNGNLIYKGKLTHPTDTVEFTASLAQSGRHDIKAYIGYYATATWGFTPMFASNSVTVFN